ncbi:FtsK SpoIIIE family protein [Lentilactobacillus kisonensis DSM 19906 = JCM 15041]|uniref:DNA translocase FtsK n=1 Tax=Lentilactobacillus kisonensis DSM 19906 = JCM 15041 TaxID=1423766 RepID=A0A0R1NTB1_9LACO|nr:FtsK SpoIIIE family protein [Lentilactobacillus kisonensis DSM 19906 = JCM 15041]
MPKKSKTEQNNRRVVPKHQIPTSSSPLIEKSDRTRPDDEAPAFLKEIRQFTPKKSSKNAARKKQIANNYLISQQRRQRHLYDELTKKLRLRKDDLIILADEQAPILEGQKTTPPLHISSDKPNQPAQPINHNNHQDIDTSGEDALPEQIKSNNGQKTANHLRTRLRANGSRRGLGQSLATIVNEEHQNPKSLALFSEPAEVKKKLAVSPMAAESDNQQSSQEISEPQLIDKPGYHFPALTLLASSKEQEDDAIDDWIEHQIDVLDKTFAAFKVDAQVVDWTNGPTVTQFQVKLALGVKVSRITNLNDDLKLALAAKDIRIEAPIPGKSTIGIEIPNPHPRPVLLSEVISNGKFKASQSPLTTALGVDLAGTPRFTDIRKMPHGLIAGATGSGKSVFINSLLVSLLYKATPADLKLLLIDPKAVELAPYDGIPHLLSPVISDPKSAAAALKWVTEEMDNRYEKLSAAGVKNIEQFNAKAVQTKEYGLKMPYILVIIDELADLMMVASSEVEDAIVRITQKARAAGIHLIVATQRPSVDIVTGTIKNNIPTRIAFMVSSQVDSRTILDSAGAEKLLGRGDMLYLGGNANTPVRLQGAFVTNQELAGVIDAVRQQGEPKYLFTPDSLKQTVSKQNSHDRLMPQVMKYIAHEDTISTSKLQRVFSIGYNRAASMIDDLQEQQLISEQQGAKPRKVYYRPSEPKQDESVDNH